jgi:hypothetical protein
VPLVRLVLGGGAAVTKKIRWQLHCCLLDKQCRLWGAPWRVHAITPWFFFAFALKPSHKFAGKVGDSKSYWTHTGRRP